MSGLSNLFIGSENPEAFMIGSEKVEYIYLGSELVYQAGEFVGIKMKSNVSLQKDSGSTANLKIKSSEPWTLAIDPNVSWLSASQLTGDTGETIVVLTATSENDGGSARTTTITATTANFSATCEVTQVYAHYVDYIHTTTLSADTANGRINTGIYPTTATTFRVKGMCKGYSQGHSIVGFTNIDAGSDSKDYRLFWYSRGRNLCFDWNNQRLEDSNWGGPSDGRLIDFTASNYNVYDNNNETYLLSGTPETTMSSTTIPIYVDVASWWLKSLEIWEGQTKVFDGKAAVDDINNIIGLFDSVSNGWFYNPNITMAYEESN